MVAGCKFIVAYVVTLILRAQSQIYQYPYGYQPYGAYPGYPNYFPYQYPSQQYEPYVSNQAYYAPYYYPSQNVPVYNPIQYTGQPQGVYPVSYPNGYPYTPTGTENQPISPASSQNVKPTPDPYANIKTDIIDIDPKYFQYYKRYFNLEDNSYPIQIIDDGTGTPRRSSQTVRASHQPLRIVKSESKSTNFTQVPHTISKHDVQSKTYSFKKTFTLDPTKKNQVINLNFVNGVQVTEKPKTENITLEAIAATTLKSEEEEEEEEEEEVTTKKDSGISTWLFKR